GFGWGSHGRKAGPLIEGGDFPDAAAGTQPLPGPVLYRHLDVAFQHDVHERPRLAFHHDYLVLRRAQRRMPLELALEVGEQFLVAHAALPEGLLVRQRVVAGDSGVALAQPADDDAHQHHREIRRLLDRPLKLLLVQGDNAAVGFCDGRCAAGHLTDRSHFAEYLALADRAYDLVLHRQADFAI